MLRPWPLAILLIACGDNRASPDAAVLREVVAVPATPDRTLDLLFVIDDSPATLEFQTAFEAAFPAFLAQLDAGGRPDLHIGAITGDLGTTAEDGTVAPSIGSGPGACNGPGKAGALQAFGTGIAGKFLVDDGAGTTNYTGTLAQAFATIASAGSAGCGFQQHLAAVRAALANPANVGFRRPDAGLGIIVLADNDDCSITDAAMFDLTNDLGAGSSYRCLVQGVVCDPDDFITEGTLANCRPRADSHYVEDPARFRDDLRALVPDRRRAALAVIAGDPAPLTITRLSPPGGGTPAPAIAHACVPSVAADPAPRFAWLANELGDRGTFASICDPDLTASATAAGIAMRRLVGDPCIEEVLPEGSTCRAFDVIGDGPELELPACDASISSGCWELVSDPATCPNAAHRSLVVHRVTPPPPGMYTLLRCT